MVALAVVGYVELESAAFRDKTEAGIKLDEAMKASLRELREASLGWVEHHAERKLGTRQLLEKS